jgi:hypothetical protein
MFRDAITSKIKKCGTFPLGSKRVLNLWKIDRGDSATRAALTALLKNDDAYRVHGDNPLGNGKQNWFFVLLCFPNAFFPSSFH